LSDGVILKWWQDVSIQSRFALSGGDTGLLTKPVYLAKTDFQTMQTYVDAFEDEELAFKEGISRALLNFSGPP